MTKGTLDIVIVGAGAAGVGIAMTLKDMGLDNFAILERGSVGSSFRSWPEEMRFITPSFPSNSIGILDLNSIAIGTSPGFSLQVEHPTGQQYARFLTSVARHFDLPLREDTEVRKVQPHSKGFTLSTSTGRLRARLVIWAGGEYGLPRPGGFPGAEHCVHASQVRSWSALPDGDRIVIGGYESGVDAAIHLAASGRNVTVLERGDPAPWNDPSSDPSTVLSPFTHERLSALMDGGRINLEEGADVEEVTPLASGYEVRTREGARYQTSEPPILATGFYPATHPLRHLFECREDGYPLLTERDESTSTPGLFLCGPSVRQENHVFCFIYKFRQRFAVVAATVAERLGRDASSLEGYRRWGMYLDDLSCCGQECVC